MDQAIDNIESVFLFLLKVFLHPFMMRWYSPGRRPGDGNRGTFAQSESRRERRRLVWEQNKHQQKDRRDYRCITQPYVFIFTFHLSIRSYFHYSDITRKKIFFEF